MLLHLDAPLLFALFVAASFGAVVAGAVGWFAIRQRGVYFVMLTLAFAQMFYFLAYTRRRTGRAATTVCWTFRGPALDSSA